MKTPVILLCVLLIAVLIVYSAAAGMDLDSLDEPSLSEDDFAIYLPLIVTEYQSGGNLSPYIPANPAPGNGDIDQGADVDLSWSGGDPDGDSVFYDVYFEANDSSPDILWCEDIGGMTCDPSALQFNTSYYWQVIARDEHDATTTGPVWVFKTGAEPNDPPFEPNSPSPADGSSDQDMNSVLSWQGGDPDGDNVTYDVFFEVDDSSPDKLICDDLKSSPCDPDTLENGASYYWQVVARDEHGVSSSSPVWTFKTENRPPTTPTNPTPADGATYQTIDVNLSWFSGDPDGDEVKFDVYFEPADSTPDKLICTGISATNCDPGLLSGDKVYYWQVVAKDEHGSRKTGPVWRFSTELGLSCYPDLPAPQLSFSHHEWYTVNGVPYIRYRFNVDNYGVFPDELFVSSPHLPPCGLNTKSSRSWVRIYQFDGTYIYGFCALNSAESLNLIWFAREEGVQPPEKIYIKIIDRQCDITYQSNYVDVPAP
jgi:hypothetical protein